MEKWKDIIGYEGKYQISNLGRVKSLARVNASGNNIKEKLRKLNINGKGYFVVKLFKDKIGKTFNVHQLVATHYMGHKVCGHKLVVDHINRDKTDNRVENLQLITNRENSSKDINKSNTSSKFIGVSFHKRTNKWRAGVQIDGVNKYLGLFDCETSAHLAYVTAVGG